MSFDATCYCPKCRHFWYECADEDETYVCPKCGHRDIEPEEIDFYVGVFLQKNSCKNLPIDELDRKTANDMRLRLTPAKSPP